MRPFLEADIPQVAELHRRVFWGASVPAAPPEAYRRYFSAVFLNSLNVRGGPCPLVYERDGRVLGFLGIRPRRMLFGGRSIVMAVCSQFVVDPAGRGQVGLQLLKACFEGPQDLTISDEAGDGTRKIWEWCGGETVLSYSMRWTRLLRPAQMVLSMLAARAALPVGARGVAPIGRAIDMVGRRLAPRPLRLASPEGLSEQLDVEDFVTCVRDLAPTVSLCPVYDAWAAVWAFERAGGRVDHGPPRKLLVRDRSGRVSGWFVYSIGRSGTAEVLQLSSSARAIGGVLDHLFADAMEQGALAVSGRLDPALIGALADKHALFSRGDYWMILHSRNAEIRHALQRGDAFLSRLEGEWCLRFP